MSVLLGKQTQSSILFFFPTDFTLSQFGDPKTLPGGYSMALACSDSLYYLPLPLRLFRSVEVKGQTGVSGTISLHGQEPACPSCDLFGVSSYIYSALFELDSMRVLISHYITNFKGACLVSCTFNRVELWLQILSL